MDPQYNTVSKWLQSKYLDWQKESGELKSIKDFANYIDISYPTFHNYLSGKRTPTGKSITKLAEKIGVEIFEILGIVPEDTEYQNMLNLYSKLNKEQRKAILEYGESLMTENMTYADQI